MESTASHQPAQPAETDRIPPTGSYRRIILATDGSGDAAAAAAGLGALAWPDGVTITVVGVCAATRPPPASSLPPTGLEQEARGYLEMLFQDERARVAGIVAAAAAGLRAGRSGLTVVETVRDGEPAAQILAQAREDGADLLVAGARGHAVLGALLLGSVSEALVEEAACPVLIVRGGAWEGDAAAVRVLIGIGPEDRPERLGNALLRLPLPDGTRVVAASVAATTVGGAAAIDPEHWRLAEAAREWTVAANASGRDVAERLAAYLRSGAPGRAVETRPLAGDVAGELLRAAGELDAGLIVVGARERRGMLAHFGLGSVSRKLVRRAGCSLLVVRGGA